MVWTTSLQRLSLRQPALLASAVLSATTLLISCGDERPDIPDQRAFVGQSAQALSMGAILSNGVVQLGVNPTGDLNVPGGSLSSGASGTNVVGVRFLPTNADGVAPGCPCEGWGVADAATGTTGFADKASGVVNMNVLDFTSTSTNAVSVVQVGNTFHVEHRFKPTVLTPFLFEVNVTIKNISGAPIHDVRYTRVVDFDIAPNTFSEYVTIARTSKASRVLYADDNGFTIPNPLGGRFPILASGPIADVGPADHGALLDLGFGSLGPDEKMSFTMYYGAAPNEPDALFALAKVHAEVYALGQGNWDGTGDPLSPFGAPAGTFGATSGESATFILAVKGVGGSPM